MTQTQIKNTVIIIVSIALFLVDLMLFAIMQRHVIDLVLCFFVTTLFTHQQKRIIAFQLLLLSVASYLDTNIFGWSMLYAVPTIFFADYLDQHLRIKFIIPYLLIIATFCTKIMFAYCMFNTITSSHNITSIMACNLFFAAITTKISSWIEIKYENKNKL